MTWVSMKQISLVVGVCALISVIVLPLLGEAILFSPAPGRALLELGVLALAGFLIVWGLMRVQGGSTPISSQPDEQEVDHWFLIYLPTGGGRFGGRVTVTNKRLLYDVGFAGRVFGRLEGRLEIKKEDVKNVQVEKTMFSRKCMITLADGSVHTFDSRRFLVRPQLLGDIDEIAAAIQAR
jgi:hypothetical protein